MEFVQDVGSIGTVHGCKFGISQAFLAFFILKRSTGVAKVLSSGSYTARAMASLPILQQ